MYLFLSSGASELYRQDILRAIAMPVGSVLQFRYSEQYLSQAVLDMATKGLEQFKGQPALLAYLDRREPADGAQPDGPPEIVPCRFAEIAEVRRIGTNLIVRFKIQEFAHTHSVAGFNSEVRSVIAQVGGRVPSAKLVDGKWKVDADFWGVFKNNPESVKRSTELLAFERTVKHLLHRELPGGAALPRDDFRTEPYFFTFQGLRALDTKQFVKPNTDGVYSVTPGKEYEFHIIHFYPTRPIPDCDAALEVSASREIIEFTSSKRFRLQSAYDEKSARFYVGHPSQTMRAVLTVSGSYVRGAGDDKEEVKTDWFDLEVKLPRNPWITALQGVMIATPLAIGPIIAIMSNDKLQEEVRYAASAATLIGAWVTGAVAALNFKKAL